MQGETVKFTHSELLLKESGSRAIYLSTFFVNFKKTYRLHHSHCAFHVALKIINTLYYRDIFITKKPIVKEISHFDAATSSCGLILSSTLGKTDYF